MTGTGGKFRQRWAAYGGRAPVGRWSARALFLAGIAIGAAAILAACAGGGWLLWRLLT